MLRTFFIILFAFVFSLPVLAQGTSPAPFLGNPMEKTFNSGTIRETDGQSAGIVHRPPPAPNITNNENTAENIWDSSEAPPQITVNNTGNGFTGWDVGPPAVPYTSVQPQPPFAADASDTAYSNTNNTLFASPFNHGNPNLQQNFQSPQPDYAALAAQYAQLQNAQLQNYYLQNNFSSEGQMRANPMQGYGAHNPPNNYYSNSYSNPYNNTVNYPVNNAINFPQRQVPQGDLFSNMLMSGAFEQNPALYTMMYQQEALRHQQSLEEEEEKAREAEEKEKSDHWAPSNYLPPLAGTLLSCFKTISPFNTPTGPDRGVGMPLMNRSWLDRPFYIGGFVGTMSGSELVSKMIDQKSGANGGLIFGFNVNDYWGLDSRLHFASLDIKETGSGAETYRQWYAAQFPGAAFVPPLTTRTNQLTIIDASVHYYPLGNAKFRPYFKYGIGAVRETFKDTYGVKHHIDTMAMPFGVGLRYWWNERLAIQMDIVDNVIFSRDITKTQNNWAFSVGVTYSLGSSRQRKPVSYWPYTPSNGSRR